MIILEGQHHVVDPTLFRGAPVPPAVTGGPSITAAKLVHVDQTGIELLFKGEGAALEVRSYVLGAEQLIELPALFRGGATACAVIADGFPVGHLGFSKTKYMR